MPAKRRRRNGKAKQRRRKGQHGRGKIKKMAIKAASEVIPGLSKGKKGNPKVTTASKIQLGVDLTTAAGTNYKNPGTQKGYEKAQDKSFRQFQRSVSSQYKW